MKRRGSLVIAAVFAAACGDGSQGARLDAQQTDRADARLPTTPGDDAAPAGPDVVSMPVSTDGAPSDVRASMNDAAAADASTGPDGPPLRGPAPGAYDTRARLLTTNSEMAIAAEGTKIYLLGGYPSSRVTQKTLQIYDTVLDRWTLGADLPIAVHHPVLVGVAGKIYSLGGQPDTGRTFEYDPSTDRWRELAPMPTARGGGGGAAVGDRIYVVGGRPPAANAFEVYDIGDNAWTKLPPLPQRYDNRNHLAAVALGGKVYVAGGRYNGGGFGDPRTDAVEMYDPATNSWTSRKPMLRPRGGVSGVAAYGCFHVYGGEGQNIGEPNDVYPDHDVYNPVTDSWTALPKLPVPFHGVTGGAFVEGLIYMPGGGTTSGGTSGSMIHQVFRPVMRCE